MPAVNFDCLLKIGLFNGNGKKQSNLYRIMLFLFRSKDVNIKINMIS